eukprot:gnl/TRDRNA2_/TRDRNA2_86510_c1_seq1.p1 gnl/TRDRNA2_/TRDRNA2_86510_c1~~gnl/TRDRNA2_/TRDRNA2_86510_c1_seq1.p1  ORF type:complete len:728 (+),score=135.86 gnl/TRDRNA2_/TRDRNA2_86510_c1_seq1:287-2185(+)
MVPYPMWAMTKARKCAKDVARELCEAWEVVIEFYCQDVADESEQAMVLKDLRELSQQVEALPAHIDDAWWECAGMGSWQKARTMLKRLHTSVRESYHRIICSLELCARADVSPGSLHVPFMRKVKPRLQSLVEEAREIFELCVEIAGAGSMTSAEAAELEAQVKDVRYAIAATTEAFQEAKKDLKASPLGLELNDEHAFCLSVCAFGRTACDLAAELIADRTGAKPIPSFVNFTGIMGTFDTVVIFDAHHAKSALRNLISILVAFGIGYFGYRNVILGKNASIASTTAILLSTALGSSLTKNLQQLQGVVLGTLAGKLVWALLGWCTWWGYVGMCFALFFWNLLCLYIYYDSPKYGSIACLLAAFGSGNFLVGCNSSTTFDSASPYYEIVNVVVSVGVMILIDLLLSPRRTSDMAYAKFKEAFAKLRSAIDELVAIDERNVSIQTGALGSLIAEAELLGAEAHNEPRYWRTPWKNSTFNQACQTLANLQVTTSAMEYSVAEGSGLKTSIFMAMVNNPLFHMVKKALYAKLDLMEELCTILAHETTAPLMAENHEGRTYVVADDPRLRCDYRADMLAGIREVIKEINSAIVAEKAAVKSLEVDRACQVSFCLSGFLMMIDHMDVLQKTIIEEL